MRHATPTMLQRWRLVLSRRCTTSGLGVDVLAPRARYGAVRRGGVGTPPIRRPNGSPPRHAATRTPAGRSCFVRNSRNPICVTDQSYILDRRCIRLAGGEISYPLAREALDDF